MVAIDTNLLVYAHRSSTPQHKDARRAIERAAAGAAGWGIALASVTEFYAVVTHARSEGKPSTPEQAGAFVRALQGAGAAVWSLQAGASSRLLQLAADLDVRGNRIFDLQIALSAIDAGALELWTHDADFVRVPGLRLVYPPIKT